MCEQALQQLESRVGPDHPDVARALNTLAELHRNEKHHAQAAELYARSLGIFEKTLGPGDVQFAEALNNLANVYSDWGKHEEAIPLYARAVEVQRGVLGGSHRNVAITLRNLGINHQELGRNAEALAAYTQALEIFKTVLPKGHDDLRALKRVVTHLRGDPVQAALASAVERVRSIRIKPLLRRKQRKKPQRVRLLTGDAAEPESNDDEED